MCSTMNEALAGLSEDPRLHRRTLIASIRQSGQNLLQLPRLGQRLNAFTAFTAVGTTVGTMGLFGAAKKKGLSPFRS
jgi:hypothetical protein